MHEEEITLSVHELDMLEQIRVAHGLRDLSDTAEWLAKRFLRVNIKRMTGRGRAMNLVSTDRTSE